VDLRFETQLAFHKRRPLHCQCQHIAQISFGHGHLKTDAATIGRFVLDDGPAGGESRASQSADDGLENRVSIGAIDLGLKASLEFYWIAGFLQTEVRYGSFTAYADSRQCARKLTGGMKD